MIMSKEDRRAAANMNRRPIAACSKIVPSHKDRRDYRLDEKKVDFQRETTSRYCGTELLSGINHTIGGTNNSVSTQQTLRKMTRPLIRPALE